MPRDRKTARKSTGVVATYKKVHVEEGAKEQDIVPAGVHLSKLRTHHPKLCHRLQWDGP